MKNKHISIEDFAVLLKFRQGQMAMVPNVFHRGRLGPITRFCSGMRYVNEDENEMEEFRDRNTGLAKKLEGSGCVTDAVATVSLLPILLLLLR